MKFANETQKKDFMNDLADHIRVAIYESYDLREEAIWEGRIGLQEMTDQELIDLGVECYDMEAPQQ